VEQVHPLSPPVLRMASTPAALKQQAAALELKKQPEKALALYQQLLESYGNSDDVDVALRNRVGDLHLRVGQVDDAIALFEKSADEYALSGFLNNAIALCNKILRQRPGHVPTLRRLARFSAEKGMVVDAQRHYLSVAEALEKLGQHGEALKALSEFAELSPEDVHVRSVVVEQLLRAGRKPDALPHLTVLHRLHVMGGRNDEAAGVAQVARDIDEHWEPQVNPQAGEKRGDPSLVFIDSDDDFGALETAPMLGGDLQSRPASAPPQLEGLEVAETASTETVGSTLDGFEATSFGDEPEPEAPELAAAEPEEVEFLDIAPAVAPRAASPTPLAGAALETLDFDVADQMSGISNDAEGASSAFGTLETTSSVSMGGSALPAAGAGNIELPDLDFELPVAPPAPASPTAPPAEGPFRPKRPTPTYINLADILRDDEPSTPRLTIGEPKQSGDEDGDFENILQEFREGIEKTIPTDDAVSHFDLGIAFREMGLLDDAIAEFQLAARSRLKRVESIEALGGCFLTKNEPAVAKALLLKALDEPSVAVDGDYTLRGVLYFLGLASEALGAREDGLRYYQRVYAVDIRFRDIAARIQTLQQPV
jgi:tetratricopeptide (TPR) repeat protein